MVRLYPPIDGRSALLSRQDDASFFFHDALRDEPFTVTLLNVLPIFFFPA